MNRHSRPRRTADLSDSIHQQLNMYAVAAAAAGVGMLALAQPSEAKIVYTPANAQIKGRLNLDLNHDGIADFEFCAVSNESRTFMYCSKQRGTRTLEGKHPPSPFSYDLWIFPSKAINQVWGKSSASALPAGVRVGPKGKFSPGPRRMATWFYGSGKSHYGGPWGNALNRYLGLKFIIKGKVHYGWARLTVQWKTRFAELTGYAYETIPGKSIITGKTKGPDDRSSAEQPSPATLAAPPPKPATLGLLAMGARGLAIWRREESVSPAQ
jgi:hypothetical protein